MIVHVMDMNFVETIILGLIYLRSPSYWIWVPNLDLFELRVYTFIPNFSLEVLRGVYGDTCSCRCNQEVIQVGEAYG